MNSWLDAFAHAIPVTATMLPTAQQDGGESELVLPEGELGLG